MDEATSNIDPNTDTKLQKVIRNEFKGSTIITIAHRLNTILDYDRIFVLDKGLLKEKGTIKELMKKKEIFYRIVEEQELELRKKIEKLTKS